MRRCVLVLAVMLAGCHATAPEATPLTGRSSLGPARHNWNYGPEYPDASMAPGLVTVAFAPGFSVKVAEDRRSMTSADDETQEALNRLLRGHMVVNISESLGRFYLGFGATGDSKAVIRELKTIYAVTEVYPVVKVGVNAISEAAQDAE
ncbi:hypothetical protein J7643_01615 [bacterium]|nr:hypothetical protein [bacterium]